MPGSSIVAFIWLPSVIIALMVMWKILIMFCLIVLFLKIFGIIFLIFLASPLILPRSQSRKQKASEWWSFFRSMNQFHLLSQLVPSLIFWEIWLARNIARFEDSYSHVFTVIYKINIWPRDLNSLLKHGSLTSSYNVSVIVKLHISYSFIRT